MRQPTLLLISQVYVPDPASVGQHMHEAAARMVKQGRPVRVLTSARGYDDPTRRYLPREELDGVSIRRVGLGSFGKRSIFVRLLGQMCFLFQALIDGVFTRNLGAVLVSTSPPMCSVVALAISIIRRVPIVYWVMDINPDQVVRMGLMSERALLVRAMEWINRRILRRAHTVVTLDRFMADILRGKADLRGRLAIIPPWAPMGSESVEHWENPFRRRHGLEGKFVFMYSGNHSLNHPLDTFLRAAEQLRDHDDIVFMFVGGGCGKKAVEAAIAEGATNVVSLPYQPREELKNSLSAADVHLVSVGRRMVGVVHPCKVYGAMAVARPLLLLSPWECHATELIGFKQYARHVEHGQVEAMVRTINEMVAMPEKLRGLMGRRAAAVLAEHYSEERLNGLLAGITEAALKGEPPLTDIQHQIPHPASRVA